MKNTNSIVAIVIPVFNSEKYIQKTIKSLIEQKYKNWRAYIVDDGSTDKTAYILDKLSIKDSRLIVIHQKNFGCGAARNAALELIKKDGDAEYIAFLDSDDLLKRNYLSRLVYLANTFASDITVCGNIWFDESGDWKSYDKPFRTGIISHEDFLRLVFCIDEGKGKIGWGGFLTKQLFRTSILSNIQFVCRDINEDEPFVIEAAAKAGNIYYTSDKLYRYRQRPGSLMHLADMDSKWVKGREVCLPIAKKMSDECFLIASKAMAISAATSIKHVVDEYLKSGCSGGYVKTFAPHLTNVKSLRLINNRTFNRFMLIVQTPFIAKLYYYGHRFVRSIKRWGVVKKCWS